MPDVFGFISVIVFGCGIYALYAYVQMKKEGKMNEALLLGKSLTESMCKDKTEFTHKVSPALLVLGITTTLYGAIDMIHYFVTQIGMIDLVANVVFMIVLVWYVIYTTKLKSKYF